MEYLQVKTPFIEKGEKEIITNPSTQSELLSQYIDYNKLQDISVDTNAVLDSDKASAVDDIKKAAAAAAVAASLKKRKAATALTALIELVEYFTSLLQAQGVYATLRFLNSRTPHRFTALYRYDGPILRCEYLYDRFHPAVQSGDDVPMERAYCSIVKDVNIRVGAKRVAVNRVATRSNA